MRSSYDVAIIGTGRVGLPLALAFADRGLRVLGVDRDPAILEAVRAGRMPFEEPGAAEVLTRLHANGAITWSDRVADAAETTHIVTTLGTPSSPTSRSTCPRSGRCWTSCCPICASGSR